MDLLDAGLRWPWRRRRRWLRQEGGAVSHTRARRVARVAVAGALLVGGVVAARPLQQLVAREAPGAAELLLAVAALAGAVVLVYFVASVTALVLAGDLAYLLQRRPMRATPATLSDHVIVCGAGRSGAQVIRELVAYGVDVAFVERDASRAAAVLDELGDEVLHVPGDALNDAILLRAGVAHARGLVATLPTDHDNLYLCLNASQLNPALRVVAKSDDRNSAPKFAAVGVERIVCPASMGGRRLAAELLRPRSVPPLEAGDDLALVEVPVAASAPRAGVTLHEAALQRDTGCVVIGLRGPGEDTFRYHPPQTARLVPGGSVIAVGHRDQHDRLRALLSPDPGET